MKRLHPAAICLLLTLASASAATVWNPAANTPPVLPPATGNWNDAGNWTNGIPGLVTPVDKAVFNVSNAADCVVTDARSFNQLVQGDNLTPGGVIRIQGGGSLSSGPTWSAVGYNEQARMIVETGGAASFGEHLWIGYFSPAVGTLDIEGGTVTVAGQIGLGWISGTGFINVTDGGVLNLSQIHPTDSIKGSSVIDIETGSVIINGDMTGEVGAYITAGRITGYGGNGTVIHDYNVSNPGKTTVTAQPPQEPGDPYAAQPTVSGPGSEGYHTTETVQGRQVWVAENMLYFNLPDGEFPVGQPVYVQIEYLDVDHGYLRVKYDSDYGDTTGDKFRQSEIHTRSSRVNTGGFVFSYHEFENPRFANRQNGNNDFRIELASNNGVPFRVAAVTLNSTPFPDPTFEYSITRPWLQPYTGPVNDFTDPNTLSGKVMTGYQGWFATPNDLDDGGWNHWGRSSGVDPSPTEITVDMWPWLDEYEAHQVYPAGEMEHLDGRPAHVFSSRDPEVVQRHFRWMRKHDIDGAYLQRFVSRSSSGYYGAPEFVFDNVRKAASKEGRVWAIEYDVSSLENDPDPLEVISNDWNWLVNEVGILDDPRYLYEGNRPVLFIWGFSVPGREGLSLAEADAVLDWFNGLSYGGESLYLIAGVHSSWLENDDWYLHYQKYDQLLAWMERSSSDLLSQKQQLETWGMKILPHAWPGFSWHNLQKLVPDTDYTARNGGDFYWTRLYNAVNCGADQIFLGMFDEYDEATAIMPMSDNHPAPHSAWGKYIDNEGRDLFWYLQLSGAAREMLNGFRTLSPSLPAESSLTPAAYAENHATIYLGTTDVTAGMQHPQPPDGITAGAVVGGHDCRTLITGNYFYFDIDDTICFANPAGQAATIEIEFYDDYPGTDFRLHYDALGGTYTEHTDTVDPPESGGWRNIRWNLADGFFGNGQNGGSDFRIALSGGTSAPIRRVSVFLPEDPADDTATPKPPMEFVGDGLEWPDPYDATGWRLYVSPSLEPSSWQPASPLIFSGGKVRYEIAPHKTAEFYRLQRPSRQ